MSLEKLKQEVKQMSEKNEKEVTYICQYKTTLVFNEVISEVSTLEDVISIEMNAERNKRAGRDARASGI